MTQLIGQPAPRGDLRLDSRTGEHIENYFDRSPLVHGAMLQCQNWQERHNNADHSRGNPTSAYNCHGLTFACRRTGISQPSVVRRILSQDSYQKVPLGNLKLGDVVVYVDEEGDIQHSGIVVRFDDGQLRTPWILSKWGDCHEVIHRVGDCPYPNTTKEYYRVVE